MAYVGGPYRYDVFFSYAYAERANGNRDDFRRWTLKLIDSIRGPLALAINAGGDGEFSYCLDRDHITPGSRLTEDLRRACEESALMVLFVSPHYMRKDWCLKELAWFLDRAKEDGRGVGHCVVVEVQSTPAKLWPADLCDSTGVPLLYHRFTDTYGEPLALAEFLAGEPREGWGQRVRGVTADIKTKLTKLRDRLGASASYRETRPDDGPVNPPEAQASAAGVPPQASAEAQAPGAAEANPPAARRTASSLPPMLYFEAEAVDNAVWRSRRTFLEPTAIVLPEVEDNDAPVRIEEDDILNVYKHCDGLVLLRSRLDDGINHRLMGAVRDQKALRQIERKAIQLAILDEQPDAPIPLARAFKVPQVPTKNEDWPQTLLTAIRRAQ